MAARTTNRVWIPRVIVVTVLLLILAAVKANRPENQGELEEEQARDDGPQDIRDTYLPVENKPKSEDIHDTYIWVEDKKKSQDIEENARDLVDDNQEAEGLASVFIDVVGSGYRAWAAEVMGDPDVVSKATLEDQIDNVITSTDTENKQDTGDIHDTYIWVEKKEASQGQAEIKQEVAEENEEIQAPANTEDKDPDDSEAIVEVETKQDEITVETSDKAPTDSVTEGSDNLSETSVDTAVKKQGGSNTCNFDKCAHHTYVYMVVPYRNRGMNLKRMAYTLSVDAAQAKTTDISCVCMAIANYDDVVVGMTAEEALEGWKEAGGSYHIQSLAGNFSRAGAMQGIMQDDAHLVTTDEDESLMFFVDTDMALFPGFLDDLVKSTKLHLGYVPVCYSVYNASDWTDGVWRSGGAGMFAAYAADLRTVLHNKFPGAEKKTYGDEDWMIQHALRHYKHAHLNTTRHCNQYLWHLPHPHVIDWTATADGMAEPDGPPKVDNFGVGPYVDENIRKLVETIYQEEAYNHLTLNPRCKTLLKKGTKWSGKFVRPVNGRRRDAEDSERWSVVHEMILGDGEVDSWED